MATFYLILLIFLGILFLVAEIVLLPGVSIGAILSAACYGTAIYLAFTQFGTGIGITVIAIIAVCSTIATIISLRAKTWRKLSLNQEIESTSSELPNKTLSKGDVGFCVSRIAPMGKVEVKGRTYEAKSDGTYIDQHTEIEVVGFENFTVIVKKVNA